MPEPDPDLVQRVFSEALALPGDERAGFIERRCGEDRELRSRVDALLGALDAAGAFMDEPTDGAAHDERTVSRASEKPGDTIGRYHLLQLIGEGGFGAVYMAEQREPVQRRVALKIIKLGMDTKQTIARFEAERQALAMMDHPSIARVFDAGATDTGRPYFVMELVRGEPITAYCDRNNLTVTQRLELFQQVCRAVQHAHQKGIIHRDIKPSNVMITLHDGRPVPKVIDFGIAKATNARLTEKTVFTEYRQLIGTPEYMSPEQAEMSGLDVDTRSDVYSLGVLLYELLTGTTPFDSRALRSAGYGEIQRIIREETPQKPSTRLSTLETLPAVAAHRQVEPRRLSLLVRGDLDWIVMKALEKDRTRRYETADAFAIDVARYLGDEPVLASPPSAGYRFRKLVRRNRGAFAAAAVVFTVLTLGVIGTAWGLARALRETDRADASARAEAAARTEAQERAEDLEQVARFQEEQLASIDPATMGARLRRDLIEAAPGGRGPQVERAMAGVNFTDLSLRALEENVFDRTIEAIDRQFTAQPIVQAQLLQATADTLESLGLFDLAVDAQERALVIRRTQLGGDDPLTLASVRGAGWLKYRQGSFEEAERLLREALEGERRVLGDRDPDTLVTLGELGQALLAQDKLDEAEACLRAALDGRREVLGDDAEQTLWSMSSLAMLLGTRGRMPEAERLFSDALERYRATRGDDDPGTLTTMNDMAAFLVDRGDPARALPLFLEVLEKRRRLLGSDHPVTLTSINNMGYVLDLLGRLEEAEPYYRESLAASRRLLGDDHPTTLNAINNMGAWHESMEQWAEAEPYFREALERCRRVYGSDNDETIVEMINLGDVLGYQGRWEEAEPLLREALQRRRKLFGEWHHKTIGAMNMVGRLCQEKADLAAAEKCYADGVALAREHLGDRPETALLEHHLAWVLLQRERAEEGLPYARAAVERYRAHADWNRRESAHAESVLMDILVATGRADAAAAETQRQVAELQDAQARAGRLAQQVFDALQAEDTSHLADVETAARECLAIRRRLFPDDHPFAWLRHNAASLLGGVLCAEARSADDPAAEVALLLEAEPLLVDSAEWMLTDPRMFAPVQLQGHDRAGEAAQRVVALYEAWSEAEPGAGYAEKASAWRARLADRPEQVARADAWALNRSALFLLTEAPEEQRDPDRALDQATRACALEEAHGGERLSKYLDTRALAQHRTGDEAGAVETQKRAMTLAPGDADPGMAQRLAEYEAALAGGEGGDDTDDQGGG